MVGACDFLLNTDYITYSVHTKTTEISFMAQEIHEVVTMLASLKGLWLAILGYVIKLLWSWDSRPSTPRIIAGFFFCVAVYFMIGNYVAPSYQHGALFVSGLLASNIINGIFKWAKVNEEEIMNRTRRWWNSDKKK